MAKAGRKKANEPSEWERRFVHEWLQNGRNATQAAITCGAAEKSAKTRACLTLKRPRVVSYIADLTQEAIAKLGQEREEAVCGLQECLEILSAHARARQGDYVTDYGEANLEAIKKAPPGLITKYQRLVTVTGEGQVFERTNIELADGQAAAKILKDHHMTVLKGAENEAPKDSLAMFAEATRGLEVLAAGNPGLMKALMRRWLSGEVIDVSPDAVRRLSP